MITGKEIDDVFSALVPLYVAMILAYGSVRWWMVITVEQCAGINRYVSVFAVPLLCFHVIYSNDVYAMNFRFIAADCLQKVVILVPLLAWQAISKGSSLEWAISVFSMSTLPNTLVMGVPLLQAMYGETSGPLVVQIVVMQVVVWYNLLLILLEYRAAKELFSKQLPPEAVRAVVSFKVEPDVHSLACSEPLHTEAELREDGKFEAIVRRSVSFRRSNSSVSRWNLRAHSGLTDVEVYSERSDPGRGVMTRLPSCLWAYHDGNKDDSSVIADKPRNMDDVHSKFGDGDNEEGGIKSNVLIIDWSSDPTQSMEGDAVKLKPASSDVFVVDSSPADHIERETRPTTRGASEKIDGDVIVEAGGSRGNDPLPPVFVMFKLILTVVCRKIIRNPNTYAVVGGIMWSLISFRLRFGMPKIIEGSITILSNTGMRMSMFSLGLFMAEQPEIITCGIKTAVFSMAVRFLAGPALAAATGAVVGLRGDLLRATIVQAALPQAIVAFVFAQDYDCHPELLSTSVKFGSIITLPVAIIYYLLIGL